MSTKPGELQAATHDALALLVVPHSSSAVCARHAPPLVGMQELNGAGAAAAVPPRQDGRVRRFGEVRLGRLSATLRGLSSRSHARLICRGEGGLISVREDHMKRLV